MQQTAKHGGIAMVHCEDDCIIGYCVHKLDREGRAQARHIHEARPNLCEEAAIRRMLLLARRSDSPLYIVHVSSIEGIEAIAEARGSACRSTASCCTTTSPSATRTTPNRTA